MLSSELSYSAPFESARLDDILPGRVELGVPICEGVVQIGVNPSAYEKGYLAVVQQRPHGSIKVARTDGSPLQVALISGETHELFGQPVESVTFLRAWNIGSGVCWIASGRGLHVPEIAHIRSFAKTVGMYAVKKQGAKRQQPWLADAFTAASKTR